MSEKQAKRWRQFLRRQFAEPAPSRDANRALRMQREKVERKARWRNPTRAPGVQPPRKWGTMFATPDPELPLSQQVRIHKAIAKREWRRLRNRNLLERAR